MARPRLSESAVLCTTRQFSTCSNNCYVLTSQLNCPRKKCYVLTTDKLTYLCDGVCCSRAIVKNPDLLPDTPVTNLLYDDFWGTPLVHSGSHKSYRPLCVLTFRLNYYLGGLDPWGYHLGNVLCHAATTALFTHLARRLLVRTFPTLVAGLLFAAHPIHTEAVAGVVGRADVLACLFYLLTLLCYLRYVECRDGVAGLKAGWKRWGWMGWVLVFTAAALLTKEQAVTVLAACATYDVFLRHRAPVRDVITLKILTAVSH